MKESSKKLIETSENNENLNPSTMTPNTQRSSVKRSFNRGQFSNRKRDNSITSERTVNCNPDIASLNSMVDNVYDEEQEYIAEPMAGMDFDDDFHIAQVKRDINLEG